jgi:F-type H+-transporting ATPase subunit delta
MSDQRIGYRYAKAIMELSIQQGNIEQVLEDIRMIHHLCDTSHDLLLFFRSPLIHLDKKEKVIKALFEGKVSTMVLESFLLLARKNRTQMIPSVAREFIRMYLKDHNIKKAFVYTATALSEASRAQILTQLNALFGVKLEIEEIIQPELIGGYVLQVEDKRFDGSFASTLRKLKKEFSSNPYIKN